MPQPLASTLNAASDLAAVGNQDFAEHRPRINPCCCCSHKPGSGSSHSPSRPPLAGAPMRTSRAARSVIPPRPSRPAGLRLNAACRLGPGQHQLPAGGRHIIAAAAAHEAAKAGVGAAPAGMRSRGHPAGGGPRVEAPMGFMGMRLILTRRRAQQPRDHPLRVLGAVVLAAHQGVLDGDGCGRAVAGSGAARPSARASGYLRLMGISAERLSSSALCSDIGQPHACRRSRCPSRSISGTRPEVDTVMRRGDRPMPFRVGQQL